MPISKKKKRLLLLAQQQSAFRNVFGNDVGIIEFVTPEDLESTEDIEYTTDEFEECEMNEGDCEALDTAVSPLV